MILQEINHLSQTPLPLLLTLLLLLSTGVSSIGTTAVNVPELTFTTSEAGVLVANTACGITSTSRYKWIKHYHIDRITVSPPTPLVKIQMTDVAGKHRKQQPMFLPFTIQAGPRIDLKADSDSGSSNTDNITNNGTPIFIIFRI